MNSAPVVVALVVSHDGARWLPQVIHGLNSQTVSPRRVIAVDTGSKDASREQIASAWGDDSLITATGATAFPAAVNLGVEAAADADWIWILHDDSTPERGALEALLKYVAHDPRVDIVGPKLREWPSLRRLLEVGVTMSGTGRRESGLERGEYDQGQHDQIREVLAVHSAGMLIRRTVLMELGGFDPQLPIFGNDLDLGWRAAQAGFRTVVVPSAVVFHAEAAHRGVRRTPLTGRHTHYAERRAALFTLLANMPARALPFQTVRILFGSLLRVIGFLCIRAVGQALDELAAVLSLYAHPRQIAHAREARRGLSGGDPDKVRSLLAPWWVPYRHGLDSVADLASAATMQAQDVAERRRMARAAPDSSAFDRAYDRQLGADQQYVGGRKDRRRRYVESETLDDELPELESGLVARFLSSPLALGVTAFLLVSAWGLRAGFNGDFADGSGALSPAPARSADWWGLYLEGWHQLAQGSAIPTPPYVLPFALSGTLLPGGPSTMIAALMMLCVPLAFWGAWRLLRVAGHLLDARGMPPWLIAIGASAYSLIGVSSGAWSAGRFGIMASAALLPWLAHAALGFAEPAAHRRWRAGWRTGMLLTLVTCFAPVLWLLAAVVTVLILGLALILAPRSVRARSAWGPPAIAIAIPAVLLSPWWIPLLTEGASQGISLESGRIPFPSMSGLDLALGQIGLSGAPLWIGAIAPILALVALVPRVTRLPVLICWIVAAAGAIVAAVLGQLTLTLPTVTTVPSIGVLANFLQGIAVIAVLLAAQGLLHDQAVDGQARDGLRRAGWAMAAVAAVIPVAGLVWAVTSASADVAPDEIPDIPAYMTQSSGESSARGVLVVRGTVNVGLEYVVRRGGGVTVGEDEIIALTPVDDALTDTVQMLVSRPTPELVDELAAAGIEYIVLAAPADGSVSARLDALSGITPVSAENRATRAWQVEQAPDPNAIAGSGPAYRSVLLGLQFLSILVVLVMCGPGPRSGLGRTEAGRGIQGV